MIENKNFIDFYHENKEEYRDLFVKMKIMLDEGKSIDPDLWEVAHCYRVIVMKNIGFGQEMRDYNRRKIRDINRHEEENIIKLE